MIPQELFCQAWPDLKFLIFTSYVPHLLYYSHLPAAIIALLLGFFVYLLLLLKLSQLPLVFEVLRY